MSPTFQDNLNQHSVGTILQPLHLLVWNPNLIHIFYLGHQLRIKLYSKMILK